MEATRRYKSFSKTKHTHLGVRLPVLPLYWPFTKVCQCVPPSTPASFTGASFVVGSIFAFFDGGDSSSSGCAVSARAFDAPAAAFVSLKAFGQMSFNLHVAHFGYSGVHTV